MKIFLKGKRMWGYTLDTLCKPKNEKNEKNIE